MRRTKLFLQGIIISHLINQPVGTRPNLHDGGRRQCRDDEIRGDNNGEDLRDFHCSRSKLEEHTSNFMSRIFLLVGGKLPGTLFFFLRKPSFDEATIQADTIFGDTKVGEVRMLLAWHGDRGESSSEGYRS